MIIIRPSEHRGRGHIDWVTSYHTFSFADYYDKNWMGYGFIRVINEDIIQPASGFNTHSHHDMEIITYVVSGMLEHKDNMGNGSIIQHGEIQRMSAGSGVRHSEFNHSDAEALHLLQIWILPEKKGIKPGYEQKKIQKCVNQFILIGSPNPLSHAVTIHQNIDLYVGYFEKGAHFAYQLTSHHGWLQLIKGEVKLNEHQLKPGDGVLIQNENQLSLYCNTDAELLFFDML